MQAGSLSCWRPFVIRCLRKKKKSSMDLPASGSFHIFCNTQPVWVFVCQSHGQNRLEVTSRAMKNHILCHRIACLPGCRQQNTHLWVVSVSNPTLTPPPPQKNRLVMVSHTGCWLQWILVTQEKTISAAESYPA